MSNKDAFDVPERSPLGYADDQPAMIDRETDGTPPAAAQNYLIYPGKAARRAQLDDELEALPAFLAAIGRTPGYGPGFRTSTRTECEVSNAGNQ